MTETLTRFSDFIPQGAMYFYREKSIYCRYQYALRDAVDPALLQQAVDAALAEADYFKMKLVREKRAVYLEENDRPFTVSLGSALKAMPEETDGYLFNVSCEGDTVYFDWFHFLADGHGVSRFLTRILMEYCNRRYGAGFACPPLASAPAYDMDALVARDPTAGQTGLPDVEPMQPEAGRLVRSMVRLDKQSLVNAARGCSVLPCSRWSAGSGWSTATRPTPAGSSGCPTLFTTASPPSATGWTPGPPSGWPTSPPTSTPT